MPCLPTSSQWSVWGHQPCSCPGTGARSEKAPVCWRSYRTLKGTLARLQLGHTPALWGGSGQPPREVGRGGAVPPEARARGRLRPLSLTAAGSPSTWEIPVSPMWQKRFLLSQ